MNKIIKCRKYKITAFCTAILAWIIWLVINEFIKTTKYESNFAIFSISWLGIIVCVIYLYFWKRVTNQIFSLLNIFLAFFAVFNFGQCFLWAIGIHSNVEIGKGLVFHSVMADNNVILQAQLLFIICYITFNTGALCALSNLKYKGILILRERNIDNDIRYNILYLSSVVIAIFVIPITIFKSAITLYFTQIYSYHDLYYGSIASNPLLDNFVVEIGKQLFFPVLLGILIGSRYSKKSRKFVYIIFILYAGISLLGGDRGEWIQPFLIFIWAEWNLYKKYSIKKTIKWIIFGIIGLNFMNAIVNMRNIGLSWAGFVKNLTSSESNAIVSMLFEFGHSMGIVIILLMQKVTPLYGNTYLMSIPTVFGTGVVNRLFKMNYVQLHTWFPQEYLKLSYGTDFSIIGEALLNYGVYTAPFILFIEGIIISKISMIPQKVNVNPLKLVISMSCMASLIKLPRSTVWSSLNEIIYFTVILVIVFNIFYFIHINKIKNKSKIIGEYSYKMKSCSNIKDNSCISKF